MYRSYATGEKEKLIALIVARTGRPRSELTARSIPELERLLNESLLAQIRTEAQNSPAAIEANQKLAEIDADRLRAAQDHQLTLIFRTPVNGRVAVDNQANRSIVTGWFDETRDERISPEWFVQVLKESPGLAQSLTWQSADVLDPQKRRQAATAQAQQDRKTFSAACRQYQISDTQANFHLTLETLGSPLDAFQIGQAAKAGTLLVSPATPTEVQEWSRDAEEQRQETLRNMSTEELRSVVRNEAESRRAQAVREDTERQIANREALDAQFGYPPLPERNYEGQVIDAAYLTRISNTNLDLFKRLVRMHGPANVTARLRGIR